MARLIGLTGGIASGKSTVAGLLAARGAVVIDADRIAREVVEPGTSGLGEVVAAFGEGVLDGAGRLDRAALGARVFADAGARHRLEEITHPRILARMEERAHGALAGDAALVVLDIPLLFENRSQGLVEGVLLAWCDAATQLRRLRARDRLDEAQARLRLAAQLPLDEKRRLADWVVDNSGTPAQTAAQVDAWWGEHADSPARDR